MNYATFTQRVIASLIDYVLLVIPVIVSTMWAYGSASKTIVILTLGLCSVLWVSYFVLLHYKFGATIGKMIAKVKVVDQAGSPLTFIVSVKRSVVDIGLMAINTACFIVAIAIVNEEKWLTAESMQRGALVYDASPWLRILDYPYWIWIISEPIVMLTNKSRRAIHDYIAGTLVISTKRPLIKLMKLA